MGHKIFVSYKHKDDNVRQSTYGYTTVREYVDCFERKIDRNTNNIYKGEENHDDLSLLSDEEIWNILKNKIYDSTLTIVFISPNMKEKYKRDRDQWIPWEISYSLKEISRVNSSGNAVASRTNAMLAVVIPDRLGSYSYFMSSKNCCFTGCVSYNWYPVFDIIHKNMFNLNNASKQLCNNGSTVWFGDYSYIEAVTWDYFINNINDCVNRSYFRLENVNKYTIKKEI